MKLLKYTTLTLLLASCRKDVQLDLPDYQQKVVIEASIETGGPASCFLSWSVPYFGEFDFSQPQTAFISGAKVIVTDGVTSETLQEVYPGLGYFYQGFQLLGQEGKNYRISVTVNGKTYETSTTILHAPKLDALYFQSTGDSLGYIGQVFTEPAGGGDCYRWLAKRLHRDNLYAAPFNSVFDDKFIDGQQIDFIYNRGRQPDVLNPGAEDLNRGYFTRGDTVVVKFCRIGRNEYNFWNTYYQNRSSNGNPFSAPANIKSMFSNHEEAFGAFTGYAPYFDTLVIPRGN